MNLDEFAESQRKVPNPVILLEGTRELSEADRSMLVRLAEKLASILPRVVFRSGNAQGADEAFSEGVHRVSGSRLECLLPYTGHRKSKRIQSAKTVAFDEVPEAEKQVILESTDQASPDCRGLANLYRKNRTRSRHTAKLLYLLRDTLKVTGSKSLKLSPAACGIFYVNEWKPFSGGTGHTIRVCEQNRLPVLNQTVWREWVAL